MAQDPDPPVGRSRDRRCDRGPGRTQSAGAWPSRRPCPASSSRSHRAAAAAGSGRDRTRPGCGAFLPSHSAAAVRSACETARNEELVRASVERFGRVDVLVNAGRGYIGAAEEVSEADLRESIELRLFGPASLVRAALRVMRAQGGGTIVQMRPGRPAVLPGRRYLLSRQVCLRRVVGGAGRGGGAVRCAGDDRRAQQVPDLVQPTRRAPVRRHPVRLCGDSGGGPGRPGRCRWHPGGGPGEGGRADRVAGARPPGAAAAAAGRRSGRTDRGRLPPGSRGTDTVGGRRARHAR
jgi:hypothetical protein